MTLSALTALPVLLLSISAGPTTSTPLDPFLPEHLRAAVTDASRAELDPKRGTNNAIEILKAEKAKLAGKPELTTALDLRIAATALRAKFLTSTEFEEPKRYEQALSTYSRLDITEPGLQEWLDRALAKNPAIAKKLGKRGTWKIRAAVLTRSTSLDRTKVGQSFASALERAGAKLDLVPAKEAPMAITVGAEDLRREAEADTAVKVTLALESVHGGKVVWRDGMFRVDASKEPAVALASGLEWVSRIGGRNLFFRWLGEQGFELLLDPTPRLPGAPGGHDHHAGH